MLNKIQEGNPILLLGHPLFCVYVVGFKDSKGSKGTKVFSSLTTICKLSVKTSRAILLFYELFSFFVNKIALFN